MHKEASSQAAWALLTEGVTRARVEAHRLQHLLNRAQRLVDASEEKDHIYQVAGDVIVAMPERLDHVLSALDRTALALAKMGEEFLAPRLSLSDRAMVDEAVESAFGGRQRESDPSAGGQIRESDPQASKLASRYLAQKTATPEFPRDFTKKLRTVLVHNLGKYAPSLDIDGDYKRPWGWIIRVSISQGGSHWIGGSEFAEIRDFAGSNDPYNLPKEVRFALYAALKAVFEGNEVDASRIHRIRLFTRSVDGKDVKLTIENPVT